MNDLIILLKNGKDFIITPIENKTLSEISDVLFKSDFIFVTLKTTGYNAVIRACDVSMITEFEAK